MYYRLDGREVKPATHDEARELFADFAQRKVARNAIGTNVSVSTVFLVLDHSFGCGTPLLFETMIFGGDHDQEGWRYSTLDEAEAGHRAAVQLALANYNHE